MGKEHHKAGKSHRHSQREVKKTPGRKMEKMLLSSKDLIWLILSVWGVLAKCKEEEKTKINVSAVVFLLKRRARLP